MKKILVKNIGTAKDLSGVYKKLNTYFRLNEDGSALIVSDKDAFNIIDLVRVEKEKYILESIADAMDPDVKEAVAMEQKLGKSVNSEAIQALDAV